MAEEWDEYDEWGQCVGRDEFCAGCGIRLYYWTPQAIRL